MGAAWAWISRGLTPLFRCKPARPRAEGLLPERGLIVTPLLEVIMPRNREPDRTRQGDPAVKPTPHGGGRTGSIVAGNLAVRPSPLVFLTTEAPS
jgi:hypothetical protein